VEQLTAGHGHVHGLGVTWAATVLHTPGGQKRNDVTALGGPLGVSPFRVIFYFSLFKKIMNRLQRSLFYIWIQEKTSA
jgi:hypothetical protein